MAVDGVLVWVILLDDGLTGAKLDPMLREVASMGPWVSAHPDVILKMGVKEVLIAQASRLGHRHPPLPHAGRVSRRLSSHARFGRPTRAEAKPRQRRSRHLESGADNLARVIVLEARRGSVPEELTLENFMARCEAYFTADGCIVDQPFQPRLPDGMIRCYMGGDKVVGFGHQLIKALIPPPPEGPNSPAAQSGPRIMQRPDAAAFQALRSKMESEWTPQMMGTLAIDAASLPIIWDADFLYGSRAATGEDTYVLCEINVSCGFPPSPMKLPLPSLVLYGSGFTSLARTKARSSAARDQASARSYSSHSPASVGGNS